MPRTATAPTTTSSDGRGLTFHHPRRPGMYVVVAPLQTRPSMPAGWLRPEPPSTADTPRHASVNELLEPLDTARSDRHDRSSRDAHLVAQTSAS